MYIAPETTPIFLIVAWIAFGILTLALTIIICILIIRTGIRLGLRDHHRWLARQSPEYRALGTTTGSVDQVNR